ncbi:hypothetical protein D8674_003731 [Pyrus ussuriensis x Pyrus communis]|uniref:Uncharacterized protein n=1 Tax=Pyrus ussuriensis x Pyrus communis TaxID=2448454 RepID=A0A5N5FHW2_9ROSA|nr:hypothetical protein D8674_003731 [Pyrus ussuriensis x Pyrus communis]
MRLTESKRDSGRGREKDRHSMKGRHAVCREGEGREEKTKINCNKFMDRVASMKTPRQQIQVNLGFLADLE